MSDRFSLALTGTVFSGEIVSNPENVIALPLTQDSNKQTAVRSGICSPPALCCTFSATALCPNGIQQHSVPHPHQDRRRNAKMNPARPNPLPPQDK
jgi:hypothetical protein